MKRLLPHAPYIAALIALVVLWQCQERTAAAEQAVAKERQRVADSTVAALRVDSAGFANRIRRLVEDSSRLLEQSIALRADFQREHGRWQQLVAGWQRLAGRTDTVLVAPGDSLPSLDAVIRQANATISACVADKENCEERAKNAEGRRVVADSQRVNAEARAALFQRQAATWQRIARPSVWDQIKQLPGRAITSSALLGMGYAACKIGGGE